MQTTLWQCPSWLSLQHMGNDRAVLPQNVLTALYSHTACWHDQFHILLIARKIYVGDIYLSSTFT
jgi:hypothetical protein